MTSFNRISTHPSLTRSTHPTTHIPLLKYAIAPSTRRATYIALSRSSHTHGPVKCESGGCEGKGHGCEVEEEVVVVVGCVVSESDKLDADDEGERDECGERERDGW